MQSSPADTIEERNGILLVSMPYASLEKPALALSILKAALLEQGIRSTVLYPNLEHGAEIGPHLYSMISHSYSHCLAGEWTFARSAFPDFESDTGEYMAHIMPGLRTLANATSASVEEMREVLEYVRLRAGRFVERTATNIVAHRPRIVGCSSTFQQHCAALALLRWVKELDPSIVTLLGGANCEAIMGVVTHRECPWVDVVVSGEAEGLFPGLCRSILDAGDQGIPLEEVALPAGAIGPAHRIEGYGALLQHPPRVSLDDMSASPMPDYDDYFASLRSASIAALVKPGLLVETSRGCW